MTSACLWVINSRIIKYWSNVNHSTELDSIYGKMCIKARASLLILVAHSVIYFYNLSVTTMKIMQNSIRYKSSE